MNKIFDFYNFDFGAYNLYRYIDLFEIHIYRGTITGNDILQIAELNQTRTKRTYICNFFFKEDGIFLNVNPTTSVICNDLVEDFDDNLIVNLKYGREIGRVCKILLDNDLINRIYYDLKSFL